MLYPYNKSKGKNLIQPCVDANKLAEDETHGYHPNTTNHLPLKVCNEEVQCVDSFTYLGSLITNDVSSSGDITSRIAKAASAMCRLSHPLFRKHRISIRTKINIITPWLSPFCSIALHHGTPPDTILPPCTIGLQLQPNRSWLEKSMMAGKDQEVTHNEMG